MHICFLALDYPSSKSGGGVGNQVRTLGLALVKAGYHVTVIALAVPGLPDCSEDHGIKVYHITPGSLHWYVHKIPVIGQWVALVIRELEYSWAAYRLIHKLERSAPIDLIEGTETGALGVALFLNRIPLVIRLHGEAYTFHKYTPGLSLTLEVRLSRVLQRIALRRARVLISPSRAHATEIHHELGPKHPPIEVVPNCIDLKVVPQCNHQVRDRVTVLYVGRLEKRKGIHDLLEAARDVSKDFPEVRFVLAGAPHSTLSRAELEMMLKQNGLISNVELIGHIPWEELVSWYQRATVCVLPSYYETFGVAALEPMAFRVPPIVSTAGALPEVVEHQVTGILVPTGDTRALANAIIRMLRDPQLRVGLGKAAQERVAQRFVVEQNLEKNIALYQWAINKHEGQLAAVTASNLTQHVFFSPHYDDVVLSCGGLINALLTSNKDVQVITVFAGENDFPNVSSYWNHLRRKWDIGKRGMKQRRQEDIAALNVLGVGHVERWDYLEAPRRIDQVGQPLYATYDELKGDIADADSALAENLFFTIQEWLKEHTSSATLYCPLSLGHHIDHQLLFRVGMRLRSLGHQVFFYEEWPYAESFALWSPPCGWLNRRVNIALEPKSHAARQYTSQVKGLGGSATALSKRLEQFAYQVGGSSPQERYWEVLPFRAREILQKYEDPNVSFAQRQRPSSTQSFGSFLTTLRWHDVSEILPVGEGYCLDVGCGTGRHRSIVQQCGYQWVGIDYIVSKQFAASLQADGQCLPIQSGTIAAVVASQMMEYAEQPAQVFAEAARVLQPGGVFCGSLSFLEPLHGKSYYNLSVHALRQLLNQHGFQDVLIKPGLSGFALIQWTWLRRLAGERWGKLAIPLTAIWLVPLSFMRYWVSWVAWRLGRGTGHGMRWISEIAPLEFAGHILFVARKAARNLSCTSLS